MINLFFNQYFLVAMAMGLILNGEKGDSLNGPIMNPSWTSFAINVSTVSGSEGADLRLGEMWEVSGLISIPG